MGNGGVRSKVSFLQRIFDFSLPYLTGDGQHPVLRRSPGAWGKGECDLSFSFTYIVSLLCREEIYVGSFNTTPIKFIGFLIRTESAQENIASYFFFLGRRVSCPATSGRKLRRDSDRDNATLAG